MNSEDNPNLSVFWIIWAATFSALFVYQFQLGRGLPEGSNAGPFPTFPMWLCIGFIAIATLIRWFLIPKSKSRGTLLLFMISGIAFAEASQLLQLFLIGDQYPETQLLIFILSISGVGQFIPFYAKRQISNQ